MDNIYEIIDEETNAVLYSGSKKGMKIVTPQDHEVVEVSVTVTPKGSREPLHYYHRLVLRFSLEMQNARILEEQAEEARLQAIADAKADKDMKAIWSNHLADTYGERAAKYQVNLSKTPVKELKLLAKMDRLVIPKGKRKDALVDAMCIQMVARDNANLLKNIDRRSALPSVAPLVDTVAPVVDTVSPAVPVAPPQNVHSDSSPKIGDVE